MLAEAYRDLKYLLNRGYRKKYALDFVADHYLLTRKERHVLARCVFPDLWIEEVKRKLLNPEELRGMTLAIDGFNVIITLESLVDGRAILCEDSLVRDLKYQGTYRPNERTEKLIANIAKALGRLKTGRVVVFYGKNTPKSGTVAAATREALKKEGIGGEVVLARSPDHELKRFETVATADTAIVARAQRVFDLARYVGNELGIGPVEFLDCLKNFQKIQDVL